MQAQSGKAELEDLHWVHGDDEGISYCYDCAVKKVEEIKLKEPESDVCVDGGWGTEEDGTESCDTCGKPLDCSFTDYGSESEVDHFIENGFDHLSAYNCWSLETAISRRDWEVWSERTYRNDIEKEEDYNYFEKLHNLCRKVLAQIDGELSEVVDPIERQAVTPMPVSCPLWPCSRTPNKAILKKDANGFMVCPLCKYSYGKLENEVAAPGAQAVSGK